MGVGEGSDGFVRRRFGVGVVKYLRLVEALAAVALITAGVALIWSYPVAMVVAGGLILLDRITD